MAQSPQLVAITAAALSMHFRRNIGKCQPKVYVQTYHDQLDLILTFQTYNLDHILAGVHLNNRAQTGCLQPQRVCG